LFVIHQSDIQHDENVSPPTATAYRLYRDPCGAIAVPGASGVKIADDPSRDDKHKLCRCG